MFPSLRLGVSKLEPGVSKSQWKVISVFPSLRLSVSKLESDVSNLQARIPTFRPGF